MRQISFIAIHEAATPLLKPNGSEYTINDVDQWHRERGFRRTARWTATFNPGLNAVGYQYVIGVRGDVWAGRHEDETPAAVQGHNTNSINICLIGQGKYTMAQWAALETLVTRLMQKYPKAAVLGHRDFPGVRKSCPDFDVKAWLADHMQPPTGHVGEI